MRSEDRDRRRPNQGDRVTYWRPRVIIREITLSLAANTWRAWALFAVAVGLILAVSSTEQIQVERALAAEHAQALAGKYTYRIGAVPTDATGETPGLHAGRCVALGSRDHVLAAAGFTLTDPVTLARAPGQQAELAVGVGPVAALWSGEKERRGAPSASLLVPVDMADAIGLAAGQGLVVDGRAYPTTDTFRPGPRIPEAAAWLIATGPPSGAVTQCWVEFPAAAADAGAAALRAWFDRNGGQVTVSAVFVADDLTIDPTVAYETRATREGWLVVGLVLGGILAIVGWFKRPEIALYRTLGSGPIQTAAIFSAQGTVLYSGAWLVSVLLLGLRALVASPRPPIDALVLGARAGLLTALVGMVAQVIAFVALSSGATVRQIKDRA